MSDETDEAHALCRAENNWEGHDYVCVRQASHVGLHSGMERGMLGRLEAAGIDPTAPEDMQQ